ncbi:MAG: radical SAM/SPASM domain-containing protein [Phycisphaerae bacterium]
MILPQLAYRMLRGTTPRQLASFAINFGLRSLVGVERYKLRARKGRQFPPFLFISVTNRCNLRCQGCWVSVDAPPSDLDLPTLDRLVRQAKREGVHFYGILGGEPLLHGDLIELFARHRDCYFQLFTNGTLMTRDVARTLRHCGNVTPLVSVEGTDVVSDTRRGGRNVYGRTLSGIEACVAEKLITGAATSVCKSNLDDLATEKYLRGLIDMGVMYAWFYSYRPSGPNPCPELALNADELVRLRQFVVDIRPKVPIIVVDTYYDEQGRGLCPAAAGISYHINPWGDLEPCPPVQLAMENIHDGCDLAELIEGSSFLKEFRDLASRTTRGCILLERPDLLQEFARRRGARDSTGRGSVMQELEAMQCLPSQHQPGREIPEKHWAYRFAKKHWFFGFGAYA